MNNNILRITKIFRFETAHVLWGYDGPCSNIHGHSYVLSVTIKGTPVAEPGHTKYGMIMDFSTLKDIVHELIVSQIDHALLIKKGSPHSLLTKCNENFGKIIELDYQPTSENMVADFAQRISARLPVNISLHSVRLSETNTSYAEWYADDQQNKL